MRKPQAAVEVDPAGDPDRAAEDLKEQFDQIQAFLAERKERLGEASPEP